MPAKKDNAVVWHHATVTRERREALNRHKAVVVWFTGLPAAGKSTIAHAVEEQLHRLGCRAFVYGKALKGEIREFTGVSSSYEEPLHADLVFGAPGANFIEAIRRAAREGRRVRVASGQVSLPTAAATGIGRIIG